MRREVSSRFLKKTAKMALVAITGLSFILLGCRSENRPVESESKWPALAGYEAMEVPADNPMTVAKVELGKQLFYDTRLSGDNSRACVSCHNPEHGLTPGPGVITGAYGVVMDRSCPTLWNIGYQKEFYWEGGSRSLESAAKGVWKFNMAIGRDGQPGMDDVCARLNQIEGYRKQFQDVFGEGATPDNVSKALACFLRTLVANDSAWVRFRAGGQSALSEGARRGYEIFKGKAACTNCHDGLLLTDLQYHNIGIGIKDEASGPGRFFISKNEKDRGAFKTPTLFNVGKSAPYFHDNSVATLEEAVDLMLGGGIDNPHLDRTNLQPRVLTAEERGDLLSFLRELTHACTIAPPTLP